MKTVITACVLAIALSGCSTGAWQYVSKELRSDRLFTNKHECMYIGCETGGMVFYPHERPQDKNKPGENYEL